MAKKKPGVKGSANMLLDALKRYIEQNIFPDVPRTSFEAQGAAPAPDVAAMMRAQGARPAGRDIGDLQQALARITGEEMGLGTDEGPGMAPGPHVAPDTAEMIRTQGARPSPQDAPIWDLTRMKLEEESAKRQAQVAKLQREEMEARMSQQGARPAAAEMPPPGLQGARPAAEEMQTVGPGERADITVADLLTMIDEGIRYDQLPAEGQSEAARRALDMIRKREAENDMFRFAQGQRVLQSLNRPNIYQRGAEARGARAGQRRLER